MSAHAAGAPKTQMAGVSVASNSALIVLKLVAGAITGSVSILSEAMHSSVDLIASLVAYFSVRKAGEPADEDHRYGHDKIENLAAAFEGMLILVGSGVIVYQAIRSLLHHSHLTSIGVGIAIAAFSASLNLVVSSRLGRSAREHDSPALEADAAHLRTDAYTSVGVLGGLALVKLTGAHWLDPVVALAVAGAILVPGIRILTRSSRVLADEALPEDELAAIREELLAFGSSGVVGYHQLRTRRAGSRRHVDMHVQFRAGTTLEGAHETAHALQDAIGRRLRGADVLIHLEPADRVRPGTEINAG